MMELGWTHAVIFPESSVDRIETQFVKLLQERDRLEEWLRFYSADDVDVDYMLDNFRRHQA